MPAMSQEERDFAHQTAQRLPTVNRVLALYVAMLAGFWGGHKFLLGARREGWLYLSLSWTGLTMLAAVADFIQLYRQPAIGRGFLKRRILARHPADRDVVEANTYRLLIALGLATLALLVLVALLAPKA